MLKVVGSNLLPLIFTGGIASNISFGFLNPKKWLYGQLGDHLGKVFGELFSQKESRAVEDHLVLPDHLHVLVSIPPKYSAAQVIGFVKPPRPSGWGRGEHAGQVTWIWLFFVHSCVAAIFVRISKERCSLLS
jgi:hypothetical protein